MQLSDNDIRDINAYLEKGQPLPDRYRFMLFGDRKVELVWDGKSSEVTNTVLPFQVIEVVDEPRNEDINNTQTDIFNLDSSGRQMSGWTNKLIWGDSNLALSSLKNGPLRQEIERQGGVKLIYIDPPFDVGADFSMDIEIGDESLTKQASALEEIAYRDTWGGGTDSFLGMLYERLKLLKGILAENGSIYVHCDWRTNSYIRTIMDELFEDINFRREIIWELKGAAGYKALVQNYVRGHESILYYVKNSSAVFNKEYLPYSEAQLKRFSKIDADGRRYKTITKERKFYLDEAKGVPITDVWSDIASFQTVVNSPEITGYPTQKPRPLLERIIKASSNKGDIVLDCFMGSGTTLEAAEKLGRKWVGCDIGRFAIHTTRKRMLATQRELKAEGKPYRAFEILNLGRYERQFYFGLDSDVNNKQRVAQKRKKTGEFNKLIAHAYGAELVAGFKFFNAKKRSRMIVIGSLDMPVSKTLISAALAEAFKNNITQVDVLGFDFEMGIEDNMRTTAKSKGIDLAWKCIPREVFDKRAVEKGQVVFHNLGYVEVKPLIEGKKLAIQLTDFSVYYSPDDLDDLSVQLAPGKSKIGVSDGQIVKISKDSESNLISQEPLTKNWSDWIDYWGIDFDFESRKEIIRLPKDLTQDSISENQEYQEVWTGDYVFENEWQSFRTKKDRKLELKSAFHEYAKSGSYKIAVKVVDIFGNDTTKVIEVSI